MSIKEQISDFDFSSYDSIAVLDSDVEPTGKAKEFGKRNNNSLFLMVVGGILLTSTCDASLLRQNIVNGTESSIADYNNEVSQPITEYIQNLENQIPHYNYTKKELIKEILSFKSLKNNWDGYGAFPLEVESASNVIEIIESIGERAYTRINDIFPNPNGTISIMWDNEIGDKISLEVGNNDMSYYIENDSQVPIFFDNIDINDSEINKLSLFIKNI